MNGFDDLIQLVRGRRVTVLAGAGCSTESGIPDYRGPEGRLRERSPVQYGDFVRSAEVRTRYWARSSVGWERVADAIPNDAHRALAGLEREGVVRGIITQNVDGLHQAAGSRRVVELHGSLAHVRCLDCGQQTLRRQYQKRLLAANPGWRSRLDRTGTTPETAPDGDAEVSGAALERFAVPACSRCGGTLKPDVVFFGENVPKERVDDAWGLYGEGEVLLVVGSSLTVYSGRRFIYRAAEEAVPVAVVNVGPTRADEQAAVKVEGFLGSVLPRLAEALTA